MRLLSENLHAYICLHLGVLHQQIILARKDVCQINK